MFNKLVYRLTKILVHDYADETHKNVIECSKVPFGYFDYKFIAEEFIRKHNHDTNCFFILKSYVLNPIHGGQSEDNLTEATYDNIGNLICECKTHHFIVNYKELHGEEMTIFRGRSTDMYCKNSTVWMYDIYDNVLVKCIVEKRPYNIDEAINNNSLKWYDDSYLLYPVNDKTNHMHSLSCYVLSNEYVMNILRLEKNLR